MRTCRFTSTLSSVAEEPSLLEDGSITDSHLPLLTFSKQPLGDQTGKPSSRTLQRTVRTTYQSIELPQRAESPLRLPLLLVSLVLLSVGVLLLLTAARGTFKSDNGVGSRGTAAALALTGAAVIVLAVVLFAVIETGRAPPATALVTNTCREVWYVRR